jgi:hypothetical protein
MDVAGNASDMSQYARRFAHFNPLFTTSANYTCLPQPRSTFFCFVNKDLREKRNKRFSLDK